MSVSTYNFKRYLTFDDVGLIPKYNPISSRMLTNISTTLHNQTYKFPFVPANMDTVISKQMVHKLTQLGGMVIYHRFCSLEEKLSMCKEYPNMYMSVGISDTECETIDILIDNDIKNFCVDVAHGHSKQVGDIIRHIRDKCPDASIIAGNVCTQEGYRFLVINGANIVKVGVGGGSACTTRMKTGFGVPQLSAIQECYIAKQQLEKEGIQSWLIADGGIKHPRDSAIAFASGADMVMMGNIFAKTYESNGKKYIKNNDSYQEIPHNEIEAYTHISNGKIYSHYRGQASHNFMKSYYGDKKTRVAEGVDFYTECIGPLEAVLDEYNGSLRSSLTYAGTHNLNEYRNNVEIFESTTSYMTESNHRSHQ